MDDRGAAMVEFAIVATLLFSLIFGIIEGAFAVRARNAVNNATDDAARRGAIAGSNANADWLILRQLLGRGAANAATIEYVVVYKADSGSDGPDAGCKAGVASAGRCNVYTPAVFSSPESDFDCTDPALDANWCPTTMRASGSQIGFLGVYVKARYEPIIGTLMFDDASFEFDLEADSLQAIETSGEL